MKVVDAKRILKLMQALDSALSHNASDGSLQYQGLRTRIEAAEQVNLKPNADPCLMPPLPGVVLSSSLLCSR